MTADPSDLAYWSTTIRNHRPPATDVGWTMPNSRPEWYIRATCADVDADWFYPNGSTGTAARVWNRRAIAICQGCPVRAECLDHALTHEENDGIWGATTAEDRALMRNRHRRSRRVGP